jgi:hypothetical protein
LIRGSFASRHLTLLEVILDDPGRHSRWLIGHIRQSGDAVAMGTDAAASTVHLPPARVRQRFIGARLASMVSKNSRVRSISTHLGLA